VAAAVVAVTEVVAVDTDAAWAETASMAVDLLVVAGASTAAVVASIAALVSRALVAGLGGGGFRGGGFHGGFESGGFHGGGFHRGGFHRRAFVGVGLGSYGYYDGYYPYAYNDDYYDDGGCYVLRRGVLTRYGWPL
jgi:hypothetical protein